MNLIHIIDCYYWIWIQSAIDNERCLWLWGSNANVNYGKIYSGPAAPAKYWSCDLEHQRRDTKPLDQLDQLSHMFLKYISVNGITSNIQLIFPYLPCICIIFDKSAFVKWCYSKAIISICKEIEAINELKK